MNAFHGLAKEEYTFEHLAFWPLLMCGGNQNSKPNSLAGEQHPGNILIKFKRNLTK